MCETMLEVSAADQTRTPASWPAPGREDCEHADHEGRARRLYRSVRAHDDADGSRRLQTSSAPTSLSSWAEARHPPSSRIRYSRARTGTRTPVHARSRAMIDLKGVRFAMSGTSDRTQPPPASVAARGDALNAATQVGGGKANDLELGAGAHWRGGIPSVPSELPRAVSDRFHLVDLEDRRTCRAA